MSSPDFANISNIELIEGLYQKYLQDPNLVDASWRYFFQGMEFTRKDGSVKGGDIRSYLMIETFRRYGHLQAPVNPLAPPEKDSRFDLKNFGYTDGDLSLEVDCYGILGKDKAPLKELYEILKNTYCNRVGFEFMHSEDLKLRQWLQEQVETKNKIELNKEERKKVLEELNRSELFETFLHTKFVGQKRFSLEGCETLIPILYRLIECGCENGVEEVVLGMAHRGRLNVLANIMNKSYSMIFHEFNEKYIPKEYEGMGDAKYHKGFSRDYTVPSGKKVHIHLAANPSHLEAVNSVVLGQTRAKQDMRKTKAVETVLIHGDAAIAGQGVVYETMQFTRLEGYQTNGSIHVVVNNQIGFTTTPNEGRSTRYCTDIAKPFGCVVFHVNAEDPEACIYASKLACQIRAKFQTDVFIDLIGYRKYGHNESDEPFFTQPMEYAIIKKKETIKEIYQKWLVQNNLLEKEIVEKIEADFKKQLQEALEATAEFMDKTPEPDEMMGGFWKEFVQPDSHTIYDSVETKISKESFDHLVSKITHIPENFHLHPKLAKIFQERQKVLSADENEKLIEWGYAEQLAYSSILAQQIPIRLAGQDARRGTFNHRHVTWIDNTNGERYFPLSNISEDQEQFSVYNSPLSEYAALGYEYGYSLSHPKSLVLWEAQFGDFCNSAQVIIDQFVTTSEEKWSRYTSLVMLLPHGYEGQGPEHSSSRIERFLELCGELNMVVAYPSTPAQYFHLLRRQALRVLKKPLIVFTPKSLLRHAQCKSSVKEITDGEFEEVLDDEKKIKSPRKLLICSGKIYYDLEAYRQIKNIDDVAIVRVEQLYPVHTDKMKKILSNYSTSTICWVQEEPKNMGVFLHIAPTIKELIPAETEFLYIGRRPSGSPATGSLYVHKQEQQAILTRAFE